MSALPKIPLDSSSDLAFLRSQLQTALQDRLQTHLPNALPEDQFRLSIEKHISNFLSSAMQEVSANILINGLEPRPSDIAKGVQVSGESYEPHDTALHAQVLRRHAELEETITRVTTMRREVPALVTKSYTPTEVPSLLPLEETSGLEEDAEDVPLPQGPINIARLEEIVKSYETSVKAMREMKVSVGEITAKIQRAKDVLTFIESQQSKVEA